MFTNNFYNAFKKAAFGMNAPNCISFGGSERTIDEGSSVMCRLPLIDNLDRYGGGDLWNTTYHFGVLFGSGTVPPTKEDYTLSGSIVYENLGVSTALSTDKTDEHLKRTAVFTIANNNDTEVTIGEVCWLGATGTRTYINDHIMMDRTLVEPVLVIPPGDVGQLTYSLTYNFPTFEEA